MFDFHAHTNFSYCAENSMTPELYARRLSASSDIDGVVIADHGMAVYFPPETAWRWRFIEDPSIFDEHRERGNEKLAAHLRKLEKYRNFGFVPGLECEMMCDGRLLFDPAFRKDIDVLIGAVHFLPVSLDKGFSEDEVLSFWLEHVMMLLNTGIDILAHPFRWIWFQMEVPEGVVSDIVDEAVKTGVALEINSHKEIGVDPLMLRRALDKGALVTFATDAHEPDQICDFSYHYSLLDKCGVRLEDINFMRTPVSATD